MCTVLMPPGVNPIAVNKYIVSYQNINCHLLHVVNLSSQKAIHLLPSKRLN